MRRMFLPVAALVALLPGCFGGGDGGARADAAGVPDAVTAPDLAVLADAVALEPGGRPDPGPASTDTGPSVDLAATDPGTPEEDSWTAADLPSASDTSAPDAAVGQLDAGGDLPVNVGGCGTGPACGPGWHCSGEGDSATCVLTSDCTDQGVLDVNEMITRLLTTGKLFVKVKALVWVGTPSCGQQECPDDHPCCNDCYASLFIGPKDLPVVLLGKGMAIGCIGTDCDVASSCQPLVPNVMYRVWGEADLTGGTPQFAVEGFCPVEDEVIP